MQRPPRLATGRISSVNDFVSIARTAFIGRGRWIVIAMRWSASLLDLLAHRVHVAAWLPYLMLLACPLAHLFMFHGHVGDGHGSIGSRIVRLPPPQAESRKMPEPPVDEVRSAQDRGARSTSRRSPFFGALAVVAGLGRDPRSERNPDATDGQAGSPFSCRRRRGERSACPAPTSLASRQSSTCSPRGASNVGLSIR